jgi:hypothetical protein
LNKKEYVTINKNKAKSVLAEKSANPKAKFKTEKAFMSKKTASLTM